MSGVTRTHSSVSYQRYRVNAEGNLYFQAQNECIYNVVLELLLGCV
jgi:hypothetical protein